MPETFTTIDGLATWLESVEGATALDATARALLTLLISYVSLTDTAGLIDYEVDEGVVDNAGDLDAVAWAAAISAFPNVLTARDTSNVSVGEENISKVVERHENHRNIRVATESPSA